jgi:hypothetical protein
MATQTSLLPVYHAEPQQDRASKSSSELNHMDVDMSSWANIQDEAFLQELLSGQGVGIIYQVVFSLYEKGEGPCTCTCLFVQLGLGASSLKFMKGVHIICIIG